MSDKTAERVVTYASLALLMFFAIFPLYMMVSNSLKSTHDDLYAMPPHFIPETPSLNSFIDVLTLRVAATLGDIVIPGIFLRFFFNSCVVALSSSALCVVLACLAGYAFSRFRFAGSKPLFGMIPLSQMFPILGIGLTLLTVFYRLNLMDTYLGLVIGITGFSLPFSIWQAKAFFDNIPRDLDDAALVDGCSDLEALRKVILPVARPGLIAILIFAFLIAWDEYIWVLLVTTSESVRTIPVALVLVYYGEQAANYHKAMAASLIFTLPVLLLFIFFQRYLIAGLTAGAVKG